MSLKSMAAEGRVKKTDKYRAPLNLLKVKESFNKRLPSQENAAHIQAIYLTLKAHLQQPGMLDENRQLKKGERLPIHDIEVNDELDEFTWIVDGHCSTTALWRLVTEDKLIPEDFFVDVVRFKGTEAECRLKMLRCGLAKELDPLELALAFKALRDEDGLSLQDLVEKTGRSIVGVRELLKLADADPAIHQLIIDGKFKSHYALSIIKQHGDEALGVLESAISAAEAQGRSKVTAVVTEGRALPKKVVSGLLTVADTLTKSLTSDVRRQLAELETLPPEQLAGRTVTVDAKVMLEFLAAQHRIEDERKKQSEKVAAVQQAASQTDLVESE